MSEPKPDEDPYFVEVDNNGCSKCDGGRTYTVIGPDTIALGQSWLDEDDAQDMADLLNMAYAHGLAAINAELSMALTKAERELAAERQAREAAEKDALRWRDAHTNPGGMAHLLNLLEKTPKSKKNHDDLDNLVDRIMEQRAAAIAAQKDGV